MLDDVYSEIKNLSLKSIVTFTSTGSQNFYTTAYPWLKFVKIICIGGGGGSGGTPKLVTCDSSYAASGGGGGYASATVDADYFKYGAQITVGAGGTAGGAATSPTGDGGAGSDSSVYSLDSGGSADILYCKATGGGGGLAAIDGNGGHRTGGSGGVGTVGDVLLNGSDGSPGTTYITGTLPPSCYGGAAGGGYGGFTGKGPTFIARAGSQYGGGAKGAGGGTVSAYAGAVGGNGIVIFELYG